VADDLYAVLGISQNATPAEIKKAYREIARKFHPDKNPGDGAAERVFTDAAEAYRVLGDDDLRAQYDDSRAPKPRQPRRAPRAATADATGDVFNDIFGTAKAKRSRERNRGRPSRSTGQRKGRSPAERGDDLRYTLELDLEDAVFGCERRINVPRQSRCDRCGGTGARAGTAPVICRDCEGKGEVKTEQGFFSVNKKCPACQGSGRLIADRCHDCGGDGTRTVQRPLTVTVPGGVETGTRLRMSGEGSPGPGGGPAGDLYVVVQVKTHPFFKREDDDVVCEVPVRFDEAALGATIEVPTLEGKVRMRVPAGSQSGRVFRLKGKGVPLPDRQGRGDQRVKVVVEVPAYVTEEQRDLLERWADLDDDHGENPMVRDFQRRMDDYYDPA